MGDMAKILYYGYYFSFTWGIVSAGKRLCAFAEALESMQSLSYARCFVRFHFERIQRMFPRYIIEGGISYCRRFVTSRHFLCGQSPHQLIIMGSLGVDTALDTD